MRLIAIAKLREAASNDPDVSNQIEYFYRTIKTIHWQNLVDVQKTFSTAEAVGRFTVFNIKGNKYRLIVGIDYENQTVYYKYFFTHSEYSKDKWKNDAYF